MQLPPRSAPETVSSLFGCCICLLRVDLLCLWSLYQGTVPWNPWFEPGCRQRLVGVCFSPVVAQDFRVEFRVRRCFTAVPAVCFLGLGRITRPRPGLRRSGWKDDCHMESGSRRDVGPPTGQTPSVDARFLTGNPPCWVHCTDSRHHANTAHCSGGALGYAIQFHGWCCMELWGAAMT